MSRTEKMSKEEILRELQDIPSEALPYAVLRVERSNYLGVLYGANAEVKGDHLVVFMSDDSQNSQETPTRISIPLEAILSVEYVYSGQAAYWLTSFQEQLRRSTATVKALSGRR